MFRGREVTHPERGTALLDRLAGELSEIGVVEQSPVQDGRNMTMLLAPSKAVLAAENGQGRRRRRQGQPMADASTRPPTPATWPDAGAGGRGGAAERAPPTASSAPSRPGERSTPADGRAPHTAPEPTAEQPTPRPTASPVPGRCSRRCRRASAGPVRGRAASGRESQSQVAGELTSARGASEASAPASSGPAGAQWLSGIAWSSSTSPGAQSRRRGGLRRGGRRSASQRTPATASALLDALACRR